MSPLSTDRPPSPVHYDPRTPPGRGEVKIAHDDTVIRCLLGDGPPLITDGYGGWAEIERPLDEPITRWVGQPGQRMELPILLDSFGTGRNVERDYERILALGRKKDGQRPPPVFRVTGAVPFSGSKWVLEESPDMGEAIYQRGRLVRQFMTLALLSYEREDTARFRKRGGGKDSDEADRYVAKPGDTLRKIAAKLKPDASREKQRDYANEIGKLNGIRDLRRELIPGVVLRLP